MEQVSRTIAFPPGTHLGEKKTLDLYSVQIILEEYEKVRGKEVSPRVPKRFLAGPQFWDPMRIAQEEDVVEWRRG
jgi:hypothetical protein